MREEKGMCEIEGKACKAKREKKETHLIQAPRIAIEQHLHTIHDQLSSLVLFEGGFATVDGLAKQRNGNHRSVACCDCCRRIGRPKEVHIA